MGVSGSTQRRWGGCSCGGLLGMLQLLLVYLPLFGSSVLKPDLHLKHTGDAHKHEIEASETHLVEKDSYWMLLNMIRNIKG